MAILTAARGLVTSPNEIAKSDGALIIADNVVIDYDNTIQSRRGFEDYTTSDFLDSVKQLFTYKNKLLAYHGQILSYDIASSGAFGAFNGSYSPLIDGLRLKSLETNGNFYFTTNTGIKKISSATADDIATSTITNSGGVKAADLSGKIVPDSAGYLPAQSKVSYRMLFGTKDAAGNLILGAPSARVVLTNQSQDSKAYEIFTVNFLTVGTIANSDYWLFNDESRGYFVWYNLDGNGTAPVTPQTLDRTGIEVNLDGITSPSDSQFANYTATALASITSVTVEVSGSEVQVTLNEPGDFADASQGSISTTEALVTKVFDGSITTGIAAHAELNFSIPEGITTAYFYQIYRTGVVTVSTGVTLNDIDPGDEQQFVYEAPITASDITTGEITITDNTPETFRQSGANLYTNAITGEGITQANNAPPIAQDIALFRNSTFYANTKDYHRFTLNMLSVDDFVSGTTKLSIGQKDRFTEYTFVGVPEVTDITVVARSGTTSASTIEINSANDERQYYIWLDTGSSVDPAIPGKLGIRVPLELYPDTVAGSKQALLDSLLLISDFTAVDFSTDVVRITCADSGQVTNPTSSGEWTVNVVTQGDGEDVLAKEVLLSISNSVGISIDLTARSLVRVINRDPDSPVTAEYLSSNEDLPGKILLEAKSLEDNTFFISISDSALTAEFNPELPQSYIISSISTTGSLFTTSMPHNLSVGDKIYINDNPGSTPVEFSGQYTVLTVPSSTTFTLKSVTVQINQPSIFGIVFKGTAASDNNTSPNRLAYSKISQPEAVPLANFLDVGSKDKAIMRILALRDNLFVLKEDGIYIVTGASAPDFSVRLLDNSAILIAPDSAVVLNNLIYALTTQGVVSISESGVSIVSRNIEDQIKKFTTSNFNYRYTSFGMSYETDRSYFLWLPELRSDTYATQCFRYNSITNTWTRWTIAANCGLVNQLGDDKMYTGLANRNVIQQERKNLERQDYADRSLVRFFGVDAFTDTKATLSSTTGVAAGDVITQEQYVSIPKFNRLLSKLDSDTATSQKDYRSSLQQTTGANMGNALIALVTKLNSDVNLFGSFTVPSGSNALFSLQEDYNNLIDELNSAGSGTALKDYKKVTDLLVYEVLITSVLKNNQVTINFTTWFIQGANKVYKGIPTKVRWAPQHFGKPQELKQISEGTLILDQNTIYSGILSYASDRSADFTPINFTMSGPGFWISYPWLQSVWGGSGNDAPLRTLVPQNKSRCRYLTVQFEHINARESYKIVGISLEPRDVSTRGYR